jgi:hypothetical protein
MEHGDIRKTLAYIDAHILDALTAGELARAAGVLAFPRVAAVSGGGGGIAHDLCHEAEARVRPSRPS